MGKFVESVFRVLFKIYKSLFEDKEKVKTKKYRIMVTIAAIMHNMIVEVLREIFSSIGAGGVSDMYREEEDTTYLAIEKLNEGKFHEALTEKYLTDDIELPALLESLQTALLDKIRYDKGQNIS